jgi:hypothetical protein
MVISSFRIANEIGRNQVSLLAAVELSTAAVQSQHQLESFGLSAEMAYFPRAIHAEFITGAFSVESVHDIVVLINNDGNFDAALRN